MIKEFLKKSKYIYLLYYYVFSLLLRIASVFIKVNEDKVLFVSYGGKFINDSPYYLYKKMTEDPFFYRHEFIWAVEDLSLYEKKFKNAKVIKIDSLRYFIEALSCGVWITNSSIERGLSFKNKKTYYLNTWHGTPYKVMGEDINTNKHYKFKNSFSRVNHFCVQGEYEANIFQRAFEIDENKIKRTGLPRNDRLTIRQTNCYLNNLKRKLNINPENYVILYCPTYRKDYFNVEEVLNFMDKISRKSKKNITFLYRGHYISKDFSKTYNNVVNVSDYIDINDLYLISDVLISDYSSSMFDFSLTEKNIINFATDLKSYSKDRGLYFDISKYFEVVETFENLEKVISDYLTYPSKRNLNREKVKLFKTDFINYYGNATNLNVNILKKRFGN